MGGNAAPPESPIDRDDEVLRLALAGLNTKKIAERLHVARTTVQRILRRLEQERRIYRQAQPRRGRAVMYERGPGQLGLKTTGGGVTAVTNIKSMAFSLPVFQANLTSIDAAEKRHQFRLGEWSGDYEEVKWKGGSFYKFQESKGAWSWYPFKEPKPGRRKGDPKRVGTVVLYPSPITVDRAEPLVQLETTAFTAAVELMHEINLNRYIRLRGIPISTHDPEATIWLEEHPSFPPGTTEITPGIRLDHSAPGRTPEIQSTNGRAIAKLAVALPVLAAAPDLVDRIERMERNIDEILRILKSR